MTAFLSRNGNNGTQQEEEEGRHYGTHFESRQQVGVERDRQAAHEEEIESSKDLSCSIDEGWNIISHHQCDMFYGRTTTVSEHQAGNVTCYFR